MDQQQFGAQGAVMDPQDGNGGTYPDQGAETPPQQQAFPGMQPQPDQPPQPQYQQPPQIDPNVLLDQIARYEAHIAERDQRESAQQAATALQQAEWRRQQAWEQRRQQASQLVNDDPERALQLVLEAAEAERGERRQELYGVIQAAGRSIQQVQQQAQTPQMIQQAAQQYQLGQDAVSFLRNLPADPQVIQQVAGFLGVKEQAVRAAQRNAQQYQAQQNRTQMQQGGAHVAPVYQGAPPAQAPADGSREQLVDILTALNLT